MSIISYGGKNLNPKINQRFSGTFTRQASILVFLRTNNVVERSKARIKNPWCKLWKVSVVVQWR